MSLSNSKQGVSSSDVTRSVSCEPLGAQHPAQDSACCGHCFLFVHRVVGPDGPTRASTCVSSLVHFGVYSAQSHYVIKRRCRPTVRASHRVPTSDAANCEKTPDSTKAGEWMSG